MIYLPIELQLKMLREDVERLKNSIPQYHIPEPVLVVCDDCNLAVSTSLAKTCTKHAPEFNIMISFPL